MKKFLSVSIGVSVILVSWVLATTSAQASSILASDVSTNYSSWTAVSVVPPNGGFGFSNWVMRTTTTGNDSFNGMFLGSSAGNDDGTGPFGDYINVGGNSFGMYANSNNRSSAYRPFVAPLLANYSFAWEMDNGGVDEFGADVGLSLRNGYASSGTEDVFTGSRFQFEFQQGSANYKIVDASGVFDTGIAWRRSGLGLIFEQLNPNTYNLTVTDVHTGTLLGSFTNRTLAGSGLIESFAIYNRFAGATGARDAFFNSFVVTIPEPSILALGLLGLFSVVIRRRNG